MIAKDKKLHFGICFIISLFSPLIACILAIGKELFDFIRYGWKTKGFWKMALGDLIADAIGILSGGTIWILLTVL